MKRLIFSIGAIATVLAGCDDLENLCGIGQDNLTFTEAYNGHLNAAVYLYQQTDRALRDSALNATGTAIIDGANCSMSTDSLIIDYGLGTVCDDGQVRRGQIRAAKFAAPYIGLDGGAQVALSGYAENDLEWEGGLSITTTTAGENPNQDIDFQQIEGNGFRFSGTLTAQWNSGFNTPTQSSDDALSLSGQMVLLDLVSTDQFNAAILTPLEIDAACAYTFVGGAIQLTPSSEDYPEVGLDFMAGDCANLFQATVDCEGNQLSFNYPIK
jgi:hypothetical protein